MTPTRTHLLSLALLPLLACSADPVDSGDGSGDAGPDASVDSGDVSVPEFPPCEDNTDCRGGEVCRDGGCREACSGTDDCTGALPACDEVAGICVACVEDGDCAPDERCDDQTCVFFCVGDRQCADGEVCDLATGTCYESECTDDGDCAGGELCRMGRCEPIDTVVCEPGGATCDGETLVQCSRDGTSQTRTPCAGDAVCVEDEAGARCADPICRPDDVGCIDADTAYLCDSTGTDRQLLPCPEGRGCLDGVCRSRICEAGAVRCEGDTLRVCNASGTAEQTLSCATDPACADAELGCACVEAACVERVCVPGSGQCVGAGVRSCSDDGTELLPLANCADDEACFGGACLPTTCTAGDTVCAGDTLLTCRIGGSDWRETDCAATGGFCDDSGDARCLARACTPGDTRCAGGGTAVERCNASGSAWATEACGDAQYCADGVCAADICEPDARTCIGGDAHVCDALGSGYDLDEVCADDEECRAGQCVAVTGGCSSSADCPPRASRCDGSRFIYDTSNGACRSRTCDYTGVSATETCVAGEVCDATRGCISASTGCESDGDCPGQVCAPDGRCVDCVGPADCGDGETCSPAGECVSAASCSSDAQCRALVDPATVTVEDVYCDPEVGCMYAGRCNSDGSGFPLPLPSTNDPFNASCSADTSCSIVFSLLSAACTGCTVGDDTTCRRGETCVADTGGLPFPGLGGNYCAER